MRGRTVCAGRSGETDRVLMAGGPKKVRVSDGRELGETGSVFGRRRRQDNGSSEPSDI